MDTTRVIALSVKSLEQQTKSVSLPRNATVLELKQKIKLVFDIDGTRQRLIFQGRVLKDDKKLLDYENLDDGKVIHLVIRPIDAPRNSNNDEPTPRRNNIRTSTREISNQYAVITVDATLDNLEDARTLMQSIMGNVTSGSTPDVSILESPFSPRQEQTRLPFHTSSRLASSGLGSFLNRSPYDFFRQGRRPELDGLLDIIDSRLPSINLPVPSSLEMRLSRTLSYMSELRSIAEAPVENYVHTSSQVRHTSYRVIQESRQRLRNAGDSQSLQVGYVLEELASLMTLLAPQLSDIGSSLGTSEHGRTNSQQLAHVFRASRMVQILSLILHFLGSILSTAEPETITPTNTDSLSSQETWSPNNTNTNSTTTNPSSSSSSTTTNTPKRKHNDDNDSNNNNSAGSSSINKKQRE